MLKLATYMDIYESLSIYTKIGATVYRSQSTRESGFLKSTPGWESMNLN